MGRLQRRRRGDGQDASVRRGRPRIRQHIILGKGIPPPPPTDKGTIEGLPTFVAEQGDIVYVPKQRWHLASFAGDGLSARLAMNGYPDLAHSFEANEGR